MSGEEKWAIVTGASSGIGRALAFEFAKGGFNVVLIARNETALSDVAAECSSHFGVDCEIVPTDLASTEAVDRMIDALASRGRRYEVLVNNAGFGIHGEFASTDIQRNLELVNVQLTAAMKLTRAVLPDMISRRSGRILNVASVYSFSPVPFQSVYAACKAFLFSFSSSLQNELKDSGVTVTIFCPGVTQTEFRSRAGIGQKRKHSGMTSQAAAHIGYVGTMRGKRLVVPGFINRLYVLLAQLLPTGSVPSIVRFINRQRGQGIR